MSPRRGTGTWHLACAGVLLWFLGAIAVLAQDDPIVVTRREERPVLHTDRMALSVEGRFFYRADTDDGVSGDAGDFKETRFEERLQLDASGYSIHPNLLEYTFYGEFGMKQSSINSATDDGGDEDIYDFDLTVLLMKERIAPLTLFTRRNQTTTTREFGGTFDNTNTSVGANWNIRSDTLPTIIDLRHTMQEQTSSGEGSDFSWTQDSLHLQSGFDLTERQRMSLFAGYDKVTGNGSSENDYDLLATTLSHAWSLGADERSGLSSSLNWSGQSGDDPVDRLSLDEMLRLQHTDNFATRYTYSFDSEEWDDREQTRHRAAADFRYRLYESLVTTGEVGASRFEQQGEYESNRVYAELGLDYTKNVPLGRLSASLDFSRSREDEESTGGDIRVVNRQAQFTDPFPVVIDESNVDLQSIVITNPQGTVTYEPELDYTTESFPDRVEIYRVLGGEITDGTRVLIDYTYVAAPTNSTDTTGIGTGLRYDFTEGFLRGFSPYVHYFRENQDTDVEDAELVLADSVEDTRVGLDYRFRHIHLNAEHQVHESLYTPFSATRLSARYTQRVSADTLLNGSISYSRTSYDDTGSQTDLLRVTGHARYRFTPRLNGGFRLTWRDEQSSRRGDTQGFEQQVDLTWRYRQTEVYLIGRNAFLDTPSSSRTTQLVELRVKRQF